MNFPVPILLPNCTCDNLREPTETHGFTHGNPRVYPRDYPREPTGLPTATHELTHENPRAPTGFSTLEVMTCYCKGCKLKQELSNLEVWYANAI